MRLGTRISCVIDAIFQVNYFVLNYTCFSLWFFSLDRATAFTGDKDDHFILFGILLRD